MSKTIEKQLEFTRAIGRLIRWAINNDYGLTFGDAYRDNRVFGMFGEQGGYGSAHSVHKLRLAVDFNVLKDGVLLRGEEAQEAHTFLHDYWDNIGGAKRITNDLNHYSFQHGKYR